MKSQTLASILVFCLAFFAVPVGAFAQSGIPASPAPTSSSEDFAETADGGSRACTQASEPPEIISEYIDNLRSTLAVVRAAANRAGAGCEQDLWFESADNSITKQYSKFRSELVSGVNSILSFLNFDTSARFYLDLILDSEIPKFVRRDNRLLTRQQEDIHATLGYIYARCREDAPLWDNEIEGLDPETSLSDVVQKLLKNHITIHNFFRAVVINDLPDETPSELLLVGSDQEFVSGMLAGYSIDTQNLCRAESDFFERISEAIDRIGELGGEIGKAIDDWEAAWAMLNNADELVKAKSNHELRLSISLTEEGVSIGGSAELAVQKSARSESAPEALGIGAQLRNIGRKITSTLDVIKNQYFRWEDALEDPENTERYLKLAEALRREEEYNVRIVEDYHTLATLLSQSDATVSENISELAEIHAILIEIEQEIQEAVPTSRKACDSQAQGLGQCEY